MTDTQQSRRPYGAWIALGALAVACVGICVLTSMQTGVYVDMVSGSKQVRTTVLGITVDTRDQIDIEDVRRHTDLQPIWRLMSESHPWGIGPRSQYTSSWVAGYYWNAYMIAEENAIAYEERSKYYDAVRNAMSDYRAYLKSDLCDGRPCVRITYDNGSSTIIWPPE